MRDEREWKQYRKWLLKEKLGLRMEKNYSLLMDFLGDIDFIWDQKRFPFDRNRAVDGMDLRKEYEDIYGCYDDLDGSCSVLEVLIAFAIRIEEEYIGNPNDPNPSHIFLEMLDNLGLLKQKNSVFDEKNVSNILNHWMYRTCEKRREFTIFPLKRLKVDQLDRDLWDQMQAYLTENY